jgi:hypothetical protein
MGSKLDLKRLSGEGLVIVVSVLLALSADAWWDSRMDEERAERYLAALARDFAQMSQRVDESLETAVAGDAAGTLLLNSLRDLGPRVDPDSATAWVLRIVSYEVFSPSLGAYEALVASGDVDLLSDGALKVDLANFFGSFQDVRASEEVLRSVQSDFWSSADFSRLVGFHRISGPFGPPAVQSWSSSDALLSSVAAVTLAQSVVAEDYRFLRERIASINARLAGS